MTTLASVQRTYTCYRGIADDTLYLQDGRPRAIFELHLPDLGLVDDDTLEVVAGELALLLHTLEFPFQLVFELVPVDLEHDAIETEHLAATRSAPITRAGREHAAFLRHLERTTPLLELRAYLVVGLEGADGSLLRQLVGQLRRGLGAVGRQLAPSALRRRLGSPAAALSGPTATELLDQRGEKAAAILDRIGADPRRLDDLEIADLLYRCWCPERARRQPLVGAGAATEKAARAAARPPTLAVGGR